MVCYCNFGICVLIDAFEHFLGTIIDRGNKAFHILGNISIKIYNLYLVFYSFDKPFKYPADKKL